MNDSERALQEAFPGAFGELYTQNAKAFRDLYAELRLYYGGANLHLQETLAEFWARLLERLFRQLHPQLLLPDDYLDCLGKQAEPLRPFGEAPRELRLRATRAFVAARTFVQGLGVAGDVVRKVAKVRAPPPAPPLPAGGVGDLGCELCPGQGPRPVGAGRGGAWGWTPQGSGGQDMRGLPAPWLSGGVRCPVWEGISVRALRGWVEPTSLPPHPTTPPARALSKSPRPRCPRLHGGQCSRFPKEVS